MTSSFATESRSEPRYEIVHADSVEVLVQRRSRESETTIRGELHNLSLGGAQILLPAYLRFCEEIELQINIPNARVKIEATAVVCWIRTTEVDHETLVGCSLAVRLSESVLDRLATAGIINRRRHPRRAVSVPATARRELDAESFPVRIVDYSEGGFCMTSARPMTLGGAVSLELDANRVEPAIAGTVCWQVERDGEYVLGCSVKRPEYVEQLRQFCTVSGDEHGATSSRGAGEKRQTLFLAATWLLVFVGGTLFGLEAVSSWRHQPAERHLAGRTSAVSSESPAAAADMIHRFDHRDSIELEASDDASVSVDELVAGQATTNLNQNPLIDRIDDTVRIQLAGELNTSESTDAMREPNIGVHIDLSETEQESHPKSKIVTSLSSVPQVEDLKTRELVVDHDPGVVSLGGAARVDWTARRTPTRFRVGRERHGTPVKVDVARNVTHEIETDVENHAPMISSINVTKAKEAFGIGERFYRVNRYHDAISGFQSAVKHDPQNAFYYYLLSMTHYQLRQFSEADDAAHKAIHLEQERPIENRGLRFSRYQGRARMWLEQLRSKIVATPSPQSD